MKNFSFPWEAPRNTEMLLKYLQEYTLDPTFINYGNFIRPIDVALLNPGMRDEERKLFEQKQSMGVCVLFGNLLEISWAFHFEVSKEDSEILKKAIDEHKKSERFQKALNDSFNAVGVESTYIYPDMRFDRWYGTYEHPLRVKIADKDCDAIKQAFLEREHRHKELLEQGKILHAYNELKYYQVHYLTEEYDDLVTLCGPDVPGKTPSASSRVTNIRKVDFDCLDPESRRSYKMVTLPSTGRRMWICISNWSILYSPIDPIIK